jgi:hypothetical protein
VWCGSRSSPRRKRLRLDKNIYRMEEVMAHQHKLLMQMERFGHPHGLR